VIGWLFALRWALGPIPEAVDAGEITVRRRIVVMRALSMNLLQRARHADKRNARQSKARGRLDDPSS
jgi:hypothetical protein